MISLSKYKPEPVVHLACRLAALLRSISAADSEAWPVNGLDPTHLAMLALKDAKRGVAINAQNPAFHRRKVPAPSPAVARNLRHAAKRRVSLCENVQHGQRYA